MHKNHLIIGGSSGIGFELVKQLSEQGDTITVLSGNKRTLGDWANVTHIPYRVEADDGHFPTPDIDKLDGLVYCPGTINLKPFQRLTLESFQRDFNVNVLGAVKALQSVLRKMNPGASVVFFSTVAVGLGMPFHTSVAASKGALEAMTRALAAELAPKIRVNCIAPSVTDTPLADNALSLSSEEKKKALGKRHALQRIGTAKEVASMAAFLLSETSGWITGQVIGIDGGLSTTRPM